MTAIAGGLRGSTRERRPARPSRGASCERETHHRATDDVDLGADLAPTQLVV